MHEAAAAVAAAAAAAAELALFSAAVAADAELLYTFLYFSLLSTEKEGRGENFFLVLIQTL